MLNRAKKAVILPALGTVKAWFELSLARLIGLVRKFWETAKLPKPIKDENPDTPSSLVLIKYPPRRKRYYCPHSNACCDGNNNIHNHQRNLYKTPS
ncbi:MAG: hypothetical protein PHX62_07345 [Bacilli bacterium]|nr:hypothetical protein [Bacilli bacterium]